MYIDFNGKSLIISDPTWINTTVLSSEEETYLFLLGFKKNEVIFEKQIIEPCQTTEELYHWILNLTKILTMLLFLPEMNFTKIIEKLDNFIKFVEVNSVPVVKAVPVSSKRKIMVLFLTDTFTIWDQFKKTLEGLKGEPNEKSIACVVKEGIEKGIESVTTGIEETIKALKETL